MDIDYNMSVIICKCLGGKCMLMNIKAFVGIWKQQYIYLSFGMFVWHVVREWVDYEFVSEVLRCVFVFLRARAQDN